MPLEPNRRISIHEDGRSTPLVPHLPLLPSANQPWDGFLLEHHTSKGFEVPKHDHSSILLSMQLSASLRLHWRSGRGAGSAQVDAGSLTLHGRSSCDRSMWTGSYDRLLFELDPVQLERLTEGRFPASRGRLPKSRLSKVREYVEANLDRDISLSALASTAAMSPYYFARLLKQTTGITPHQYVVQRRIERAKELLRDPNISVFEVGIRVGYLDPKHFRDLFRREVRATPTDYRSSH